MPVNDELGKRMKEYYEQVPKTRLVRRMPVAIRIDGKAFHTFTRGFEKPFDRILILAMQNTMQKLCENIQGCVFGYTQSDEITLILKDYNKLNTSAWFDYEVQKMCSIAASMATLYFNQEFRNLLNTSMEGKVGLSEVDIAHMCARDKGAMFDARCFNIPKEEVANLIYWRQIDAYRNSRQMAGQAYFSAKELNGKSCTEIVGMLKEERGIDFDNDYFSYEKYGTVCYKEENEETRRPYWVSIAWDHLMNDTDRAFIQDIVNSVEEE